MALYLGSYGKQKIILNNIVYSLNLFSEMPIMNYIRLLSSDNYILRDSSGLYLTAPATANLLSLDNYMLVDSNGVYLTIKESE